MIIGLLLLALTFIVRIFDGIEHGLHWASRPRKDTGDWFHTADLWQTFAVRGIYILNLPLIFGLSQPLILAILATGIVMLDQAVWQIFLNKFAGNSWFGGELDEASFEWWPTSDKLFANKGRIVQILIGLALILLGLLI